VTIDNYGDVYLVKVRTSAGSAKSALDNARATVGRLLALMSLQGTGVVFSRSRRASDADVRPVNRLISRAARQSSATLKFACEAHPYQTYEATEADGAALRVNLESRLQHALSLFYLGCCALDKEAGFISHHTALEILSGENKKKVLKEHLRPPQISELLEEVCALFERNGIPGGATVRLRQHLADTKLESDLDVHARYVVGQRAMIGTLAEVRKSLSLIRDQRGRIVHAGHSMDSGSFSKHRLLLERTIRKALLSEIEHAVGAELVGLNRNPRPARAS